jgi:hypothetical protein
MVRVLLPMLMVLEPDPDWSGLARIYNGLKQTAAPVHDELA